MFVGPNPIEELHARACNKGTKTETLAAYVLACMQKRRELDGLPLPQWRGRIEALCGVLDFKQQLLSVQPAYLRLLGQWPSKARYNGETLTTLQVQPIGGNDDPSTWSILHFLSQENPRTGVGARADITHFDEPMRMPILRELRKASHANRPGIRLIGETPTIRSQWYPIKEEYGDNPRDSITRVSPEMAEVRWSLYDIAAFVLSPASKARLLRLYEKDPIKDARIYGDYCDATGKNPLHIPTLREMLKFTRDPHLLDWKITREMSGDEGIAKVTAEVDVQVWEKPKKSASYYIPIDSSSGIDDPLYDPGGIHVREVGTGNLVARYSGYLGSYGLGTLAAGLARQYNDAMVDPETQGGWGEGVLRGLSDAGYGRICKSLIPLRDGTWHPEYGFKTTASSRPMMVTAVQQWVIDWAAGIRYAECPSREVLECFLEIILDERAKAVAAPGFHDEDFILWGQGLRRTVDRSGRDIPMFEQPGLTGDELLELMIKDQRPEDTRRSEVLVPRMKSRA